MLKKEVLKKVGAPILAGILVLGGVGGYAGVYASTSQAQPQVVSKAEVADKAPDFKGTIIVGEKSKGEDVQETDSKTEDKEDVALAAKAKITKDEATNAAKAVYPDYEVKDVGVGEEDTYLVYEVNMVSKSGEELDVKVDAGNSKIIRADKDTEDKSEGNQLENNKQDDQDNQNNGNGIDDEKSDQGQDNDNVQVE